MKKIFLLSMFIVIIDIPSFCQNVNSDCIDSTKICPSCICIMNYGPVCGCDGKSYSNPCIAYKHGVLHYTPIKWMNFQISGPTEICQSEKIELTASGGLDYSWNTGAKTASILVAPDSSTTYSVVCSDSFTICKTITYIQIKVNPKYEARRDTTINLGDTLKVGKYTHCSPGIYYDTLKTHKSCDSVIITNLKVNLSTNARGIDKTNENFLVNIYPIPASKFLKIESVESENIHSIEIISINGTPLKSQIVNSDKIILNLEDYSCGFYVLKIRSDKNVTIRKILIK